MQYEYHLNAMDFGVEPSSIGKHCNAEYDREREAVCVYDHLTFKKVISWYER